MRWVLMWLLLVCCLVGSAGCCLKERIADVYNQTLQTMGSQGLTGDLALAGERCFGIDQYVGNYTAVYQDFSGEELLFGGTGLYRADGNQIQVDCSVVSDQGTVRLIWRSGTEEDEILLEGSGTYCGTLTLPEATNYILVQCEGFSGSVAVSSENT